MQSERSATRREPQAPAQAGCGTAGSLTAALSAKTYWLPRYAQAKAAATVTMKLNTVMTTALTERTAEQGEKMAVPLGQAGRAGDEP